MQVVLISDTHNKHLQIEQDLPDGDMIIHSGDISGRGTMTEIRNFLTWYSSLPYKWKVFIAGNHDWAFEDDYSKIQEVLKKEFPDIIYLQESGVIIDGIKIYGAPHQPRFHDWAFNVDRDKIHVHWDRIPDEVDILITHGPPYKHGDYVEYLGKNLEHNVGCKALLEAIERVQPQYSVFGHIHSGSGVTTNGKTVFVNASVLDEGYNYAYKPRLINVEPSNKKKTMKHSLVTIIKNDANFISCKNGVLTYSIAVFDKDDFTVYKFDIDTNNKDDVGEGEFKSKEKGIMLMRWVKRSIEDGSIHSQLHKYE